MRRRCSRTPARRRAARSASTCPERFALNQAIPALPGFHARYPDLRVVIGTTDRFVDLVADGIDCAVRVGAMSDTSLVARRIGELAQINCAAPAYLERHGTPRSPDELPDHVAVGYFSSRTGRELDWEYADMDSGRLHAVKMRSVVSVNSSQAYLACCLAGLGLIQAPREAGRCSPTARWSRCCRSGTPSRCPCRWCFRPAGILRRACGSSSTGLRKRSAPRPGRIDGRRRRTRPGAARSEL